MTTIEQTRFNMIEQQIRPWNVLDADVLHLLALIKREDFVPAAHHALAFVDMEIPLLDRGESGQVMLAPRVEARLLQDLKVQKHEKVLEIGTGSGYMAALLAHRAQQVLTIEIDPTLAQTAKSNLDKAGIYNVTVHTGDGAKDQAKGAPFDVILLSGSVAEVPQGLLAQLKVGGRLGAIVGDAPMMRATFITRTGENSYTRAAPWDTMAPRLKNFTEPSRFSF